MIRKVVLTTGLLLLAYSIFIYVFRSHIQRTAQIVEQRNTVKGEEFLYENSQKADTIIVGSSMSNRLVIDSLPGHYYNLSLEGMASVDGLWLIVQARQRPRLLLVEINTLDRLPDTTFFANLVEPGRSQLRKYIPFTRLKYQPVGVMKALLRDWHTSAQDKPTESIDTAFVTKVVQERLTKSKDIANDNQLNYTIELAGKYIRAFRSKGTQVVFYEMPTDPRIRKSNVSRRLRELVDLAFPATTYQHIRFPSEYYQTTDGVHLPQAECIRYTRYLYQQLKQTQSPTDLAQIKPSSIY